MVDNFWNWLFHIDPDRAIPDNRTLVFDYPTDEVWVLAAVFGGLALLAYVVGIYRREARTVGGGLAGALTVLRVLAISVVVLVLMRPRWEWEVAQKPDELDELEPEPPSVVFLVDESRSMTVKDSDKDATDKAAEDLAKTLGYALPGAIKEKTRIQLVKEAFGKEAEALARRLRGGSPGSDAAAASVKSGAPVHRVRVYAFAVEAREVFNDEYKRRMRPKAGEEAAPVEPDQLPEASQRRVAEGLRLDKVGTFKDPRTGRWVTVEETLDVKDTAVQAVRDEFAGRLGESNIGGSLRALTGDRGGKIAAIVLVSDGRNNGLPLPSADALKKLGYPIHTVGVGNPEPLVSLQVAELLAPESIRKGESFNLRILVGHVGLAGKNVEFDMFRRRVQYDDKGVRLPAKDEDFVPVVPGPPPVRLDAGQIAEAGFTTKSDETGEFEYKVKARAPEVELRQAKGKKDDEKTVGPVRILDDRIKVLLVAGDGGWEYRAFKNLLVRSTGVRASVLLQGSSTDFSQEASLRDDNDREMPEMRINSLPRSREKLSKYDVVILFDPVFSTTVIENEASLDRRIDPKWCELLHELVTDRGMGLVYAAGVKNTPLLFDERDPADASRPLYKSLQDLMPVVPEKFALRLIRGTKDGFPFQVTERQGRFHPILRFVDKENEEEALQINGEIWSRLPRVFWAMPVREIKPSAIILAEHNSPNFRLGDQALPLMVEQRSGIGRSLYLGFDSTWRWRFLGDNVFNEFWMRTIKYMVEGRRLGGRRRVNILTDGKPYYRTNDPIELVADLLNQKFEPLRVKNPAGGPGEVVLNVTRVADPGAPADPGDVAEVKLTEVPGKPGTYRGSHIPRRAGQYQAALKRDGATPLDPADELPADDVKKPFNVVSLDREMREVRADFKSLEALAADTGGTFVKIGELNKLADKIKDPPVQKPRVAVQEKEPKKEEKTLWDVPFWLILFSMFLIAEWGARKIKNLA